MGEPRLLLMAEAGLGRGEEEGKTKKKERKNQRSGEPLGESMDWPRIRQHTDRGPTAYMELCHHYSVFIP